MLKIGTFTLVIVAALTPLLVFALLVVGPTLGLVRWEPPVLWTTSFGIPLSNQGNRVTAISAAKNGLFAGGFARITDALGTQTGSYLFLNRYDLSGHETWSHHVLGDLYSEVDAVGVGNDGVYAAGSLNETAFVQKVDLEGNNIWTRQLGGYGDKATSLALTNQEVFVGGGDGTRSSFLREYNTDGTFVASGINANFSLPRIELFAGSDGLYVTGSSLSDSDSRAVVSKYYFNGTLSWTRPFDEAGFTCACYPNGISGDASGTYVSGATQSNFPGYASSSLADAFIRKYDPNGNVLWTRQFSSLDLRPVNQAVISENSSGVYVLVDGLIKYDVNGNRAWSERLQNPHAAMSAGEGAVFIGGFQAGSNDASISALSDSSSLILFGVNPPSSFLLAALFAASIVVSFIWLRRNWKRKSQARQVTHHGPEKPSYEPSFPIRKPV